MHRQLFIGDIHGCLKTLTALLQQLQITKQDTLYFLGDYINRGPDSKGVIDAILNLKNDGYTLITLTGNHEQLLINDYIAETEKGWHDMADEAFKSSFKIDHLKELPQHYIEFCKQLPFYHIEDHFIAVHAGLNFNTDNPLQSKEDLIWIRNWYQEIDYKWLKNKIIIHGHTPLTKQEIEAQFSNYKTTQVLNIDCGVFMHQGKIHGLGHLCAFDLTNERLYFQDNIDY